jgi:glucose/arabinose dehydrogenase
MTSIGWPGPHRASAAVGALLCVTLAACSGGGAAASPSPHPAHARAAAAAEPVSGPAAVASVTANWKTFFSGAAPIPRRLALLQDGQQFASFVRSHEKTADGALILQSAATVSSVTLQPGDTASVTYTILLSGKPLEKNLQGSAIYSGGRWKVAVTTFCGLLRLAFGKSRHSVPAACGS